MTTALSKRIPVSEGTWKQLHNLKEAGETYDQLLQSMMKNQLERNRRDLYRRMQETEKMSDAELVPLNEL